MIVQQRPPMPPGQAGGYAADIGSQDEEIAAGPQQLVNAAQFTAGVGKVFDHISHGHNIKARGGESLLGESAAMQRQIELASGIGDSPIRKFHAFNRKTATADSFQQEAASAAYFQQAPVCTGWQAVEEQSGVVNTLVTVSDVGIIVCVGIARGSGRATGQNTQSAAAAADDLADPAASAMGDVIDRFRSSAFGRSSREGNRKFAAAT
jgi:hypothetical protein